VKTYRAAALVLAAAFLIVGLLFLAIPDGVISFFNRLSGPLGLPEAQPAGRPFFLVLASGYMYLVSLLAWLMFKHPENPTFPTLLFQGKLATSLLSLGFFLVHRPFLIYLANFCVDGLIAAGVWWLGKLQKERGR
jgi:hypothetical protein